MTTLHKHFWPIILAFICALSPLNAQLSMPSLFSNDMVLQRNEPIKIWGNTSPGAAVNISLHTQLTLAIADENGYWEGILGALSVGGPYQMVITSEEHQIEFSNIMMGEVWICAGQSNMARYLKDSPNATNEIQSANWPNIRYLKVPNELKAEPSRELSQTSWSVCSPTTAQNYSAVGYFMGRDLHLDLNVPIGIIDITWGGTQINTWISLESLSIFPEFANVSPPQDIDQIEAEISQQQADWDSALETTDLGLQQHWENDIANWENWETMLLPKPWEADALANKDGSVWFKRSFNLSASQAANDAMISLGKIDDSDQSWINGQLVGGVDHNPGLVRQYPVPASILQTGENIVTVRVRDYGFVGGLLGGASDMKLEKDMWQISLVGHWNYKEGNPSLPQRPLSLDPDDYPSLIYNGMVHPLIGLQIAGVCWYQGESDVGDPFYYRGKQIRLIDDWRERWDIGDFPFIVTQLPFFRQVVSEPGESSWATLRESQTYALKRANTAIIGMIDTGDPFDIHPQNKYTVGTRLSKAIRKLVYQQNIVASGPRFFTAIPNGNEIQVFFRTFGSSLQSNNGNSALQGFAIAGADGNFVWADAYILNSQTVAVSHPSIPNPLYVRYAWSDNPWPLNLFNTSGLPAFPFRTDEFETPWE